MRLCVKNFFVRFVSLWEKLFMKYFILKNNHYSLPPHGCIHFGATEQKIQFRFDKNCIYQVDEKNDFTNKLFGWSYGLHHKNSIRVGWRPAFDAETSKKIDLFFYSYNNGIRKIEYFHSVYAMVDYNIIIRVQPENNTVLFKISEFIKEEFPFVLPKTTVGYFLYPYFGGTATAPHLITINLKRFS